MLARYSRQPWFVVQCSTCGFVYLRNSLTYEQLVSEFAWEKTRAIEKQRRKRQSPYSKRSTRGRDGEPHFSAAHSRFYSGKLSAR